MTYTIWCGTGVAGDPHDIADSKRKLIRKIYAEWHDLGPSGYYEPGKERAALRGFLKKRFGVDHENFLTPEQAIKVIEAVKAIKKRRTAQGETTYEKKIPGPHSMSGVRENIR